MDKQKEEILRIAVNQFYMNKYMDQPVIKDEVFDPIKAEYRAEGKSEMDLVEWEAEKRENTLPIGLNKRIVYDNDLAKFADEWISERAMSTKEYLEETQEDRERDGFNPYYYIGSYFNYKYDGCSILGIYENGRLKEVRSTPDEEFGIVRTKAFLGIFPENIPDKDVIAIQGEALVDYRAYGQLARNKANGLVNSIHKDDEVRNEIFIRIYKAYFTKEIEEELSDSQRFYAQLKVLDHLPKVKLTRNRLNENGELQKFDDIVFAPAYRFIATNAPSTPLVQEQTTGGYFQVDGIVAYTEHETLAMKFYYTESAVTTVRNIQWTLQSNGGWAPKVQFDPIVLNDKNISQASSGGTPNMLSMKFGVGAKIRIILANMTIPKIVEVLETSEVYNFPKCDCGYQTSDGDIFGSSVKCRSIHCERRANQWLEKLTDMYEADNEKSPMTKMDYIKAFPFDVIDATINIDRWNAGNKIKEEYADQFIKNELIRVIESKSIDRFKDFLSSYFYMSELQYDNMLANYGPAFEALKNFVFA